MSGEYAVLAPPTARGSRAPDIGPAESSARVALLAAAAYNTYLTLPLYATSKEDEGQPIAEGTIRSSKAPGQPHKCHRHLQNEVKLKSMPVRNAVDQKRLR